MYKFLLGVLSSAGLAAAVATIAIAAGWVDFAADTPHHPAVFRTIEWIRETTIQRQARGILLPVDIISAERARRGAGNYEAMCVNCHLAPGAAPSELSLALYPAPPNLAQAPSNSVLDANQAATRRFWIIKHGVKASGMPAWSKAGVDDEAIWDLVSFLQGLPGLSAEQYRQMVTQSDGHSHHGGATPAQAKIKAPAHTHSHGDHAH